MGTAGSVVAAFVPLSCLFGRHISSFERPSKNQSFWLLRGERKGRRKGHLSHLLYLSSRTLFPNSHSGRVYQGLLRPPFLLLLLLLQLQNTFFCCFAQPVFELRTLSLYLHPLSFLTLSLRSTAVVNTSLSSPCSTELCWWLLWLAAPLLCQTSFVLASAVPGPLHHHQSLQAS